MKMNERILKSVVPQGAFSIDSYKRSEESVVDERKKMTVRRAKRERKVYPEKIIS